MELSLSVRVAESFSNKRVVDIALPDLAGIARRAGYAALCMRASVVGVRSAPETVASARVLLRREGLAVSMVTGDFAVPENGDDGPGCLRKITPHLDLAQALGCDLIRVCIKTEADIPFAQKSADEAADRNIRLAHQSHTLSLFETVEGSLDVLRRIGRSNFGLIYEPANLALCGEDYGPRHAWKISTVPVQRLPAEPRTRSGRRSSHDHLDERVRDVDSTSSGCARGHRLRQRLRGAARHFLQRLRHRSPGIRRPSDPGRSHRPIRKIPQVVHRLVFCPVAAGAGCRCPLRLIGLPPAHNRR